MDKDIEVKERIMNITMSIIREYGDISSITIRKISERAGISVGSINYHFQTKDNLIDICVQYLINREISSLNAFCESLSGTPHERLRTMLSSAAESLVSNPEVFKIAIMSDLKKGIVSNNSIRMLEAFLPAVRAAFGESKTEYELRVIVQSVVGTIQTAFLYADALKQFSGIDFFDKTDREEFMDTLLDNILSSSSKDKVVYL
ncbi:MAG: TetR/AcrR family transcriptional regulator [Bacillota bacterium]